MRKLLALAASLAVLAPSAALAATEPSVDTSEYPIVRATVVFSKTSPLEPTLLEGGEAVAGLSATNLGRARSIVLAVDRSRSMNGRPLADAVAAARQFLATKLEDDRIAVGTFATEPLLLTTFSTSAIDADGALRSIAVDDVIGTTLYDGLVLYANALSNEYQPGRLIILVTDGNETRSKASLEDAIAAARSAGAAVYVVAIESAYFTPEPLKKLAADTGGSYFGAESSATLASVYSTIAEELTRTWRLEYVTDALPGEKVSLAAKLSGESVRAKYEAPGAPVELLKPSKPGRLPAEFFGTVWGQALFALVVGLVVLLSAAFAFASPKGTWLRGRLAPHVVGGRRSAIEPERGERFALAAAVFRATENALGKFQPWQRLNRRLERADLPLRTVEFVYAMLGSAVLFGIVAAGFMLPWYAIGLSLVAGGGVPYAFAVIRARKRLRAFESQLPDLLGTMAAGLKAGHSFRQALQSVVDEDQPPASKELKRVLTETRLGRPMEEALIEMAQRIGSKNFEFVITAVTIQRQVGGSLAGLFDMVADTVRNRQQFAKKIKGLTAMGRASAYVLIGLPFFVAGLLTMINPEYMSPLWTTGTGHKLIGVMLGMMLFGSFILRRIVSFRY